MGSFADFLELEILDHIFGNATAGFPFTPAATIFVGLSTTTITDAGGNITEPVGAAYARKSVANTSAEWPAAAAGLKSNGQVITFATATGSWGTVIDFFIADAATAGNIYLYGTLTTAKTISNGDTAQFAVGDLDITLT